ncbi:uncharacterized protein TNIN_136241 [Trichonephila inaurata madagascariensis]|uniref:Uncharacterized protein n=1 Tax=Trichonephila inaurata madagascariensis TaxID=2747483 RepID=A0A8X7CDG8_9ARAC|nr:uncharacterized protein TNIN_136241 [Trichonephila inaurata madagascariensis]
MHNEVVHIDGNVMTTLTMHVGNIKLADLWELQHLGILDPTLEESKQNSYEEALINFQEKLTILPNGRTTVERKHFELSSHEIKSAEKVLIRIVQGKMFPNLSSIPLVNAFKDNEGVIRIKTKLRERMIRTLLPILLPSNCILTTRLIEYYHYKHCHAGVQILMSYCEKNSGY